MPGAVRAQESTALIQTAVSISLTAVVFGVTSDSFELRASVSAHGALKPVAIRIRFTVNRQAAVRGMQCGAATDIVHCAHARSPLLAVCGALTIWCAATHTKNARISGSALRVHFTQHGPLTGYRFGWT